jgi:putative transposase
MVELLVFGILRIILLDEKFGTLTLTAIRSERQYYATINYIHNNLVKHGWAESNFDWNQSSINWYLQEYGKEWLLDCCVKYYVENFGAGWND